MTLDGDDIRKLTQIFQASMDTLIKDEVERAVQEIPFRVRGFLSQIVEEEVKKSVQKAVEASIDIQVRLK